MVLSCTLTTLLSAVTPEMVCDQKKNQHVGDVDITSHKFTATVSFSTAWTLNDYGQLWALAKAFDHVRRVAAVC